MNSSTLNALRQWLALSPESYHPCDMERFYNIFKVAISNGDLQELKSLDIELYVRAAKPNVGEDFVNEFCSQWHARISTCVGLLQYLDYN